MNNRADCMCLYVTEEEASILRDGLIFLINGAVDAKKLVNDAPILNSLDELINKYRSLFEKLSDEGDFSSKGVEYALVEFFVKENDTEGVKVERTGVLSKGALDDVSEFFRKYIESELCILKEQEDSSREEFFAFFNNDGLDKVTEEVIIDTLESRNLVLEAQLHCNNTCTVIRKLLSIVPLTEV